MKKKKLLKISLIIIAIPMVLIGSLIMYVVVAKGMTFDEILLPIKMLGNCGSGSDDECGQYCDNHPTECIDALEKVNEIAPDLVAYALDKFNTTVPNLTVAVFIADMRFKIKMKEGGERFCNSVEHFPDCIDSIARYTPEIFTPQRMAIQQKLAKALRGGVKLPGGLSSVTDYNLYCENSIHTEECNAFNKQYVLP